MKVSSFCHGMLYKNNYILLRPTDIKDEELFKKMFVSKKEREGRTGEEILIKCELDAQFQKRTYKQLSSAWKLITVIFESMEHRKPTDEERYELYIDLLDEYADKTPSKINGRLRPVHISESNTVETARFIDGLLFHLSTQCNLNYDLQADVRSVLYEWEIWRGQQEKDFKAEGNMQDWRARAVYSEASGLGGAVDLHHIVSRGAAPDCANEAWNFMALTRDEHTYFHQAGPILFCEKYPHLTGRIENAYRLAGQRTPQDVKNTLEMVKEVFG